MSNIMVQEWAIKCKCPLKKVPFFLLIICQFTKGFWRHKSLILVVISVLLMLMLTRAYVSLEYPDQYQALPGVLPSVNRQGGAGWRQIGEGG
jgi:hypothetical protein